jgi:DivIVA domain-containing protein
MAEDLSPRDIRTQQFNRVRRGYDRDEVTRFLARVADRLDALEKQLATLQDGLFQLGITKLPDLKEEIEDIGVEVQNVLDSAMAAAEGIRIRATEDAAATRDEADQAGRELRGNAWSAGTELLEQADQEADRLVREASEDALFIRAQAEQDAKRLVSDARHQADDIVRSSREEGERIVVIAKAESEAILESARQSAEQAQERARALENRRSELLNELEAAESAIRDVETGRAQRDAGDSTVRVIEPVDRTHWPDDDGSVRVLPTELPVPFAPEPVDAEEVAAEVERMQSAVAQAADATRDEPPVADVDQPLEPELEGEASEVPTVTATEEEPEEPTAPPPEPPESIDRALSSDAIPSVDKVTVVQDDPAIDDLFAKLRRSVDERVEPGPEQVAVDEPSPSDDEDIPAAPALTVVADLAPRTDFDIRDRLLLPLENQALRSLKRRIVELQNSVLEGLRRSPGEWRLGRDQVADVMGDELDAALMDSFRAGHGAAAEIVGRPEPEITGGPEQGAAEMFTADLHRDVQSVLERGEAGSRRLSAEVGRVFRSWRTDEAERHVHRAARRAYNDGLLAGYGKLGIEAVEMVAPGRPCGRCSAGSGLSWDPAGFPPEGVSIPPAGPSCEALIAPFSGDGSNSGAAQ